MLKSSGKFKKDEETIRKWLKDHVVLTHRLVGYNRNKASIEELVFGKPGTIFLRIYYLLQNSTLMVYGDVGEAVYRWHGRRLTFSEISGFNIGYFFEKCRASENGSVLSASDWDADQAKSSIFGHFKDQRSCSGYKKFKESVFYDTIEDKDEFHSSLRFEDPDSIFGDDWWDWVPGCGDIIPRRIHMHLIGIKMAMGR